MSTLFIHPTAEVEAGASVGEGTKVWHLVHVRRGAQIGEHCILARGVFIDAGVRVGARTKIQNYVSVFHGVTIEEGVFVGPHVCFTNDKMPRAVNADGTVKSGSDWVVAETLVRQGASIGAHATIVCGVSVGRWAMVGAGSVVTRDVPDHALVVGNPARIVGYVTAAGVKVATAAEAHRA